ncbi:RNA polymerase subunit sigma [Streptomyces griseoincarnatus]|uniref:RNA polymerase subunit sigma n=1 Tax=Streptomyces sp. OS603R TaxID=3035287 RepID=UPI002434A88A|nr:RNA polymerase subunit sigma [Streptomyces sp. OS603R]
MSQTARLSGLSHVNRVDDGSPLADLLDERRHLVTLAHRMLGSADDAESAVDECYRRWYALSDRERERIPVPLTWLAAGVGRICRARRVLPPPEGSAGAARPTVPDAIVARPRAAEPTTLRQHTAAEPTTLRQHDAVVHAVRRALVVADVDLLLSLLAPDAAAFFDGGGKIRTLVAPVHGRDRVARGLLRLLDRGPHTTLAAHSVNGRTGLVVRHGRRVVAVLSLDVSGTEAAGVWVVVNPDKLRSWNAGRHP